MRTSFLYTIVRNYFVNSVVYRYYCAFHRFYAFLFVLYLIVAVCLLHQITTTNLLI